MTAAYGKWSPGPTTHENSLGCAVGLAAQPFHGDRKGRTSPTPFKGAQDNGGRCYSVYYASNGKGIAQSSDSQLNRSGCTHSNYLVQDSASHPIVYFD